MATDSGYAKRDFLRVCDICGHRFHFSQLKPIGELKFACPDDAPGLTALQISRYNARARPLVVRPNKHAKALTHTPIYQLAEAEIFNFIAQVAPAAERDGADSPLAAAWATIYMADVIIQSKRPTTWNRTAWTTIERCLTYLLTKQYGSYTGITPAGTADNPRYGGILVDTTYSTTVTIAAGVAFLKAYAVTGNPTYLDGAKRAATFMRHSQSGDVQATAYTTYPAAGGRYHIGGLASGVSNATGLLLTTYLTADIGALWFLKLLADVVGAATMYGDAVPTAFFGTNRASLATMSAELTTFAELGPRDSTTNELTPGLSTTAPRATYQAAINGGGGAAKWEVISNISSDDIAMALRGLYESGGLTPKVDEMMAWLAAFTSNAVNHTPDNIPESAVLAGITGTYDPKLAPATVLTAAAPFTESDSALYGWSSLGLLSPILATTVPAAFRISKDTVSMPVRYSTNDITKKYLGPIGSSGLSLQPFAVAVTAGGGLGGGGFGPPVATTPAADNIGAWFESDRGITKNGTDEVTDWVDYTGNGWDVHTPFGSSVPPTWQDNQLNGLPGVYFGNPGGGIGTPRGLEHYGPPFYNGPPAGAPAISQRLFTRTEPNVVISVVRPDGFSDTDTVSGGMVFSNIQGLFAREVWVSTNGSTKQRLARTTGGANSLLYTAPIVDYTDDVLVIVYRWDGANMYITINGAPITTYDYFTDLPSTVIDPVPAAAGNSEVLMVANSTADSVGFHGHLFAVLAYHGNDVPEQTLSYVAAKYAGYSSTVSTEPSVVKAAKTGMVYRQSPGHYPQLRGN